MTAASQDMDGVPEKHLTVEEKTKLKERLALLKKEYKKTVHRLQRSQRAERVKTHVKKTIEEQNRLLSQELSKEHSLPVVQGSLIDTNNVTESTQSVDTSPADKEKKLSVSFNLDPEILHGDRRSPSRSGSESSGQEPGKTDASGSSNPNQCKRSRLRLNRSARREPIIPSVQVISLGRQRNTTEAETTRGPTLRLTEDEALKINSVLENTRRVQGSPEYKNDLAVNVLEQQYSNIKAPASPVFKKCLKEEEKDTLDTGQSQDVTTDRSPGDQDDRTGKELAHSNISHLHQSRTGDQRPPGTRFEGGTSEDLTLAATCDLPPIPQVLEMPSTSPPRSENLSVAAVRYHGELCSTQEERSPLDSCTLVEGLLFPVEYYVRTTRRMTSCQRKVDLEAVIHSHLGTARKGTRGRPRRASTSTPSLQVSGTPLGTSHSATRSRRGRGRKSCPALVSSGLDSISKQLKFGSDTFPIANESQGGKETLEEKELSNETCAENLQMEESLKEEEDETLKTEGSKAYSLRTQHDGNLGLHTLSNDTEKHIYNLRTSAKTNEPSSPLHLFGGRLDLQHLLHHLDITDFHLPDEDFGVLKLEKLKSTSHPEAFVPETAKETKKYRRAHCIDDSTPPASDNSALLHGGLEICTRESRRNSAISKGGPDDEQLLGGNQAASQHDRTPSQTFLRETPEVFHLSPSKEDDETRAPDSPVNHSLDDPQWERTYFNADVSKYVLDPEPDTNCMETLREGFVISSTNMESPVAKNPPSETKPTPDPPSPKTEVTYSVLLSTSMCSVPPDTRTECASSRYPTLGTTPAVFLSPHGSTPAPCEEETSSRIIDVPPEESAPINNAVTQDDGDTDQYSESLLPQLPPSGDAAPVCVERKPCSNQEHEANAKRSDECDKEWMLGVDRLRLVSEIKDTCGGGCPVDLCSVWWEFSGSTDLCIVSASEYSVCLWRPQEVCHWKCVHTWTFTEMPVIQILPLSQEKNVLCVALGNLDIMEIWALSSHPELQTWDKQLVKRGHTKTAQGLSQHRVVSSSGGGDCQVVELWQLSENGSVAGSHTLVAPTDSVVAFSEVDGERDALVGSTVDNNLVLWNSVTGHLLGTFYIGNLCSDLTCISATSDSGLLFLVVGSLFSTPRDVAGSCVFRLIATNPQEGASAFIMAYTLPEGLGSRYLEGDVKKQRAAAVLTCGSIALWDISRSHCSAVLPPDSDAPWCLVRWGNRPSCVLAGRKDGTVCVFEYTDCR